MKTNFFENIAGLGFNGNLNMTIAKQESGELAVSVLLANDKISDTAGKAIPPVLLRGIATELDEGFFEAIATPIISTTKLFANMDEYQKGLDNAKLASKQEQDKKNKSAKSKTETTNTHTDDDDDDEAGETETLFTQPLDDKLKKEERKRAYDELIKQVGELNQQCKYDEAIAHMPKADDYPEKAEEIIRKTAELQKRKAMYDELKKDF